MFRLIRYASRHSRGIFALRHIEERFCRLSRGTPALIQDFAHSAGLALLTLLLCLKHGHRVAIVMRGKGG